MASAFKTRHRYYFISIFMCLTRSNNSLELPAHTRYIFTAFYVQSRVKMDSSSFKFRMSVHYTLHILTFSPAFSVSLVLFLRQVASLNPGSEDSLELGGNYKGTDHQLLKRTTLSTMLEASKIP